MKDTWRRFKIRQRLMALQGNDDNLPKERRIPETTAEVGPGIDGVPLNPVYESTRAPGDVVLSGPLAEFKGSGRRFATKEAAYYWACDKYGVDNVTSLDYEGAVRWAVLVKNLRK